MSEEIAGASDEVEEHHTTVLSARDWKTFTELLDNPPRSNEALERAFRSYRERVVPRTDS